MLAIKVVGPDRVTRRFSVDTAVVHTWEDIERQIKTLHALSEPFYVTYLDEDNEEIRIDSDGELADLIAGAKRQGLSSLRFTVTLKDGSGNAPDPRESNNSVATYRTQASQNLSSIIPPPPSPKSFDREGWQVLDDGTPSGQAPSHSTPASQSFRRSHLMHSDSSDERPSSQPFEIQRDSDAAFSSASFASQASYAAPVNPFDDFNAVPPLFPAVNPDSTTDVKARADVEAKLYSVIAENEAKLEDMKKNGKVASAERNSRVASASSPLASNGAFGNLPEDVRKFIEQVRSVVSNYPDALRQLNTIVDQQLARNVNVNLEYAIQQIQASIAKVHHESVEMFNSASANASGFADKYSKVAREAAYRARIESYDASRRAYEEAKSAARMAREALRQARGGRSTAGSPSTTPVTANAIFAVPSGSEKQDGSSTPLPSFLSSNGSGIPPYTEAAKSAANAGYGLGMPAFPAYAESRGSEAPAAQYAKQMGKLKDMGFVDEGLNLDLLSQNDGEVERVVEILMQLGL